MIVIYQDYLSLFLLYSIIISLIQRYLYESIDTFHLKDTLYHTIKISNIPFRKLLSKLHSSYSKIRSTLRMHSFPH